MNHPDIDMIIVFERRRDELAEAAHYRILKQATAENKLDHPIADASKTNRLADGVLLTLARFLSFVGERMLNWSCRLQYRYAVLASGVAEKQPEPCS